MNGKKVYITKHFEFEACHYLPVYEGKCAKLHGHSYKMDVTVSRLMNTDLIKGSVNLLDANQKVGVTPQKESFSPSKSYMVMDFGDLSSIVKEHIISVLDHSTLNNYFTQPTAEVMVICIFDKLRKIIEGTHCNVTLESVKLWETSTSFAEYKGGN